jgi:hypothetical protein
VGFLESAATVILQLNYFTVWRILLFSRWNLCAKMCAMKTKRRPADVNQLICRFGTARFYQVKRAQSEWKKSTEPEFKGNWMVRFHCGGRTWEESAGPCYPVADGLKAVKEWAETRMETELEAARAGKLNEMRAVVRPASAVTLDKLGAVYLANVPPGKSDYAKNWQRLKSILTESTGRSEAEIDVTDGVFSRAALLGWVRMRQEHFRRGWTAHNAAPKDAWVMLRRDLAANKLPPDTQWPKMAGHAEMLKALAKGAFPGVDKETQMECNTTIKTYIRCAKAVFANQREYLMGLELPALTEFLGFSVDLSAPEGHREIDSVSVEKLLADAERLQRDEPKVWAWEVVVSWTGARPITIKSLIGDALAVMPDGSGVITLPARKGGVSVRVPVDSTAVQSLQAVRTQESLLGAKHKTEANEIHRSYNGWLTKHGVTGTLKSYLKRHMRLQQYRTEGGLEVAAAGGGHRTTKMVEQKYTKGAETMPMMVPARAVAQAS